MRRVLRKDGTVWLNVGSSYAGSWGDYSGAKRPTNPNTYKRPSYTENKERPPNSRPMAGYKPLDLIDPYPLLYPGLLADGWYVRSVIVWAKPNPMPESVAGWFFTKHRITIKQYESLQVVRGAKGASQNGAAVLSGLQGNQGTGSEVQVQQQREGKEGSTRTLLDEASPYTESQANRRGIEGEGESTRAPAVTVPREAAEAEGIPSSLPPDREWEDSPGQEERPPLSMGDGDRPSAYGSGVAADSQVEQVSVLLLQGEKEADDRPRDTAEQGRPTRSGERSPSLSKLQLEEARPDSSALIDCPGCARCIPNGGLVLRKGSWRPTSSYEYVIMLAKSASYYGDGEGVREPQSGNTHSRGVNGIPAMTMQKTSEPGQGIKNNSSFQAAMHDLDPSAGRNLRDVWQMPTQPYSGAHFATYPEELVKRCILASTPDAGVCAVCGSSWARVLDRLDQRHWTERADIQGKKWDMDNDSGRNDGNGGFYNYEQQTLGWRPTCAHTEATPATILDPFGGSGTSAVVARSLGRRFVLCELSSDYVKMALRRLMLTQPAMAGLV